MPLIDGFPSVSGAADQFEIRKDLAGLIVRDTSGAVRTGVFYTGTTNLLAATATMNVSIAPFLGVSARSGGPIFNAHEGTDLLLLDTAPASNSRIDVIYYKQNETAAPSSDTTDGPVFGFVKGTAAPIPTKPALTIPGAVELGTVTIPSTATATNSANVAIATTVKFTATSDSTVYVRNTAERDAFTWVEGQRIWLNDRKAIQQKVAGTDKWLTWDTEPQAYTPTWTSSGTSPTVGSGVVTGRYMERGLAVTVWTRHVISTGANGGSGTYRWALPFPSAPTIKQLALGGIVSPNNYRSSMVGEVNPSSSYISEAWESAGPAYMNAGYVFTMGAEMAWNFEYIRSNP